MRISEDLTTVRQRKCIKNLCCMQSVGISINITVSFTIRFKNLKENQSRKQRRKGAAIEIGTKGFLRPKISSIEEK